MPNDIDKKTGRPVVDVIKSKHPNEVIPDASKLQDYVETPDFVDIDITVDTVEKAAQRLAGNAGLGGMDSNAVSKLLLQFGKSSHILREAVVEFARWMANDFPPWAAYRAIMSGRLIALDKNPGI